MRQFILFGIYIITMGLPISGQVQSGQESLRTVVLQLPLEENNPRNSEGDFITLKNGRILFIYTHYTGTSENDNAPAYLAGRFSDDGGKIWSKDDFSVLENEGGMNVMSVSLLRLKNGNIALFYLRKNSETDCIPMMRISTDEAKTWTEPVACITDKKGYFVLNNNRVIQLKNGRLLMAVALHEQLEGVGFNQKGRLFSYYSDDNGATWHCSEEVANPAGVIAQEPGVVELKDGTIMMFIRASGGFQQFSHSKDKGQTWSPMVASNIPSPLSPASIARIPSTGDLLLVWNNNDERSPQTKGWRTPLTVAVSKDEGKTWQHITNIETDSGGCYCYIAIHFTEKDVLLGYCGGAKLWDLTVTNVALLRQKDLYGNKIQNVPFSLEFVSGSREVVMVQEYPWEEQMLAFYKVLKTGRKKWQMWYNTFDNNRVSDYSGFLNYAHSKDGKNWIKSIPGRSNNIIRGKSYPKVLFNPQGIVEQDVIIDESSPLKYKMIYTGIDSLSTTDEIRRTFIEESADGIHWTNKRALWHGRHDSQFAVIERNNQYHIYLRTRETYKGEQFRTIGLAIADKNWNIIAQPVQILHADFESDFPHLYNSAASKINDDLDILFPTYFNEANDRIKIGVAYTYQGKSVLTDMDITKDLLAGEHDNWAIAMPGLVKAGKNTYWLYYYGTNMLHREYLEHSKEYKYYRIKLKISKKI